MPSVARERRASGWTASGLTSPPRKHGGLRSRSTRLGDLAQEGLEVLSDAPPQRRADLLELAAFADLLVEGTQTLRQQWEARRDALRASGELPS
jgi:hypothetical protein